MSETKRLNILIVGAGPTGLTTALELLRLGLKPRIIDRRDRGSGLSRAVGILPSSLDILQPSGVAAKLKKVGVKLESVEIFDAGKPLIQISLETEKTRRNALLSLPQDQTESILRQAIESLGGEVEFGTTLEDLSQENEQVTCHLICNGRTAQHTFDYVVAADGIQSTARQSLGLGFPGHDLPDTWSVADIDVADWNHAHSFCIFRLTEGKIIVIAPMGPNRLRLVANRPNALSLLPVLINVTNIRREGDFTISIRQMEQYRQGRILFAGDAAHAHSPVGGQGMNLGIGDAGELAARLADGTVGDYGPDRHKIAKSVIASTERARKMFTSSNATIRLVSERILRVVSRVNWLRNAALNRGLYVQSK